MRTIAKRLPYWFNLLVIFTLLGSLLPPVRPVSASSFRPHPSSFINTAPATGKTANVVELSPTLSRAEAIPLYPLPDKPSSSSNQLSAINALAAPPKTPASDHPQTNQTAAQSGGLLFIENAGQFDERARFQVRGAMGNMWLAEDALWFTVLERLPVDRRLERLDSGLTRTEPAAEPRREVNLKLSFPGANPRPRLEPFNRLESKVSYFIGNDPARWRADVSVWGGVRYVDLYPGVDLEITGKSGRLVQRLVVRDLPASLAPSPGEKWGRNVRLHIEGADALALKSDHLRLSTAVGEFTLPLWQAVTREGAPLDLPPARPKMNGQEISAPFASTATASLVPAFPPRASALLASPLPLGMVSSLQEGASDLIYSTFLGGSGSDIANDVAVDEDGNAYVIGFTRSFSFPITSGALDGTLSNRDAFVTKLNADGTDLVYSTFLGGSDSERGKAIQLDNTNNAYIVGSTWSHDFPATQGAFDTTCGTDSNCNPSSPFIHADAFVAKLNTDGTGLVYATFLGGSSTEKGSDIAVDEDGNAYVTGYTSSTSSSFPFTSGALDETLDGDGDAFVTKLNADGTDLVYSTFLGGSGSERGEAIQLDNTNNAYIVGRTWSPNFPATQGAFDTTCGTDSNCNPSDSSSHSDAFVAKLNTDGTGLVYATFLGGSSYEEGHSIAVDSIGNAYVAGDTSSQNFPTTAGAIDTSCAKPDNADAFVAKLNADGSGLAYATCLEYGDDQDGGAVANDIVVDSTGNAYVGGETWSQDFPTTPGAFDEYYNGPYASFSEGFVSKLSNDGTNLVYSTYLGGSNEDYIYGMALDSSNNVYVVGEAHEGFPTTPEAYDPNYDNFEDAFVAKLALGNPPTYTISGSVLDESGNPITGTTFLVTTPATSTTLTTTVTITPFIDAMGRYTTYVTGPISVITATAQGFEMFPPFYRLLLPETGAVLQDVNFVGTVPPDVVPPNIGLKGANWLRFVVPEDPTGSGTDYSDRGIGWNLETADTIDIDEEDYIPPLPEGDRVINPSLGQEIADFTDFEGVYTIIRLQTPPPPDPALLFDLPWEDGFIDEDGLLTEDFTQVLRQELGGELSNHANLVITAPVPDVQWRIEDNGQIYIVGRSENTLYVFDSPYYFEGTYDRHNMDRSCDDLGDWMSLLDTEVDSIINHPALVNADPKPVQIFILGNEPNHFHDEWNYSGSEYAHLYNCYYQHWIKREELQDKQGDRLYALFAAGPGQIGPCERVVTGFAGNTPQWLNTDHYETDYQNCKGIDATNSYGNTHGFVPFYQEMLTTGVETIENADGFAIHAYGYDAAGMVFDRDVNSFPPDGWLATAMGQIRTWRENQGYDAAGIDVPVIVTEYNPGASSGSVNPPANGWEDWFNQTYCWTITYTETDGTPEIDGLLYFVDSAIHSRLDDSDLEWWPVSLQSDPERRGFWLNVNEQSCSEGQIQSEEILYASIGDVFILPDQNNSLHPSALQTYPSISGIITGTLGQPENRTVYQVTGDLEIPAGQVLTITANTSLIFDPGYGLKVAGQLIADGNSVRPIRFLSTDAAGWSGIEVQPSSQNSRCLGCYLENIAPNGVGMRIEAPITLQHSFIRGVPGGTAISTTVPFTVSNIGIDYVDTGIHVSGSITTPHHFSHLTLSRCQQGFVNQGQTLEIDNSILTTCGFAVSTALSGTTAISYSLLHANGEDFVTATGAQLITGTGILTASPNFVDFPDNLHLLPGSSAVNAADPQADYSREPGYNGNRADLGMYGNTPGATEEPPLDQMAVTLAPLGSIQRQAQPGQTVTYTFTLKNSGDITDTYKIKTVGANDRSPYFSTSLYRGGYDAPRYVLDLAPQQQISMTLWVYIPLDTTSQVSDTVSVKAIGRYGISDQLVLTTTILAFQESGGQVVMEAEHFAGAVARGDKSWITQTTLADYSGSGYVSAWPDTDLQVTANYTSSPELNYTINITTTGVYTVWLRGYAPNAAGDSLYVGLDDQPATKLTGFAPGQWSWANDDSQGSVATIEITEPGWHILHLWQREDGLRLDRIVLTTDSGYNPSGNGPPESERN